MSSTRLTTAAGPLVAVDLWADYRFTIDLADEFITGGTSSGAIGLLGWQFTNGTVSQQASEANRPGIVRRATSASSGTAASMYMYGSATAFDPALPHMVHFECRLNQVDTNTTVRIGVRDSASASPPTNGIYFEKLDADTNWFVVTRAASSQTRADTGVACDTSFHSFKYFRTSTGVQFFLDTVSVGTSAATIPTAFCNPSVFIINSAAADKTIDTDYFRIRVDGLARI